MLLRVEDLTRDAIRRQAHALRDSPELLGDRRERGALFEVAVLLGAVTIDAAVETLKVEWISPPVPQMSIVPSGALTATARDRMARTKPVSSSQARSARSSAVS